MIRPNMATMLGFMATDAKIDPALIQPLAKALADALVQPRHHRRRHLDQRFLRGDRDAEGGARHHHLAGLAPRAARCVAAMQDVARQLAQAIVRDGEGATKFITVRVEGGRTRAECRQVAYAIAHSPLVKTAFFASDPNLGPHPGGGRLCRHRRPRPDRHRPVPRRRARGRQGRAQSGLPRGRRPARDEAKRDHRARRCSAAATPADTVWTCDLSHDYVSINADYRS